ncbi:ABC transporter permease subunit [Alicyclobacillus tolerans]|uniref:ABC-2 family transporter protein n=1 Tax=Alicyclobacillus tolerans TaxID=90970 RepID=A0A1M6UKU5_9BACL|nr:ABC transporter permease subunit [Alicyclobacillus montanus]SHK69806.1 hypothetical protein SAMN05443507_12019 [Alicyclobacillus montanus]
MEHLSITRFELYKLFSRKSIWILLTIMLVGLFLPLQLLIASTNHPPVYQATPPTKQQLQQAKTDLPIVQQKLQNSHVGSLVYWDLWHEYQRDQAIASSYSGTAVATRMYSLQESMAHLKASGQMGFAYRADKLEYDMLKNLPFIGGGMYNGGGAMMIDFFKTYGFIIYAAMILIGLAPIFSEEYASGTDNFLLTAKRGKRQLVSAKVKAALLYSVVIGFIIEVWNLGLNALLFGTQGLNYPIQSIPLYRAPFHLTIQQYILVAIAIFLFGGVSFSCIVLLVSALSRMTLISFVISTGIFVLPALISKVVHQFWSGTLLNFSYTGLLQVSRLYYHFLAYNVLGHPVLYPILVFPIFIVISLIVTRLVYVAYGRHQVV